jgi:osmoprotectant transport system permease protein
MTRAAVWMLVSVLGLATCGRTATAAPDAATDPALVIGSKADVEAQVLGLMLTELARSTGAHAAYQRFGGTQLAWEAIVNGQIDAYPEYTGTLIHQIFSREHVEDDRQLQSALAGRGLAISRPLGFNNTWAVGMKASLAERLGVPSGWGSATSSWGAPTAGTG